MKKTIPFYKMHGCGNDFVLVDCREDLLVDASALAQQVLERRFSIGGDQLLVLKDSERADAFMEIYNPDGSEVEMCGNALRCVALYLSEQGPCQSPIKIDTLAGVCEAELLGDEQVRIQMAVPSFSAQEIALREESPIIDGLRQFDGLSFKVTAVSMGNPHLVIHYGDLDSLPLAEWGPIIENNELFVNRINVEFVHVNDSHSMSMRVWERGAGETLACGSGACAAAVAAIVNGRVESPVKVSLRGGDLNVEWAGEGEFVYMTGPASFVFQGFLEL